MKDDIVKIFSSGVIATVTFTKKDGSERVMRATTNAQYIPTTVNENLDKPKRTVTPNPDVARVFDLDKSAWRSFRYDSVKSVTVAQ